MFKRIRIALLLYVLALVAVGSYLSSTRSTDWDASLWVDVYPVDGDGSVAARQYIEQLQAAEFDDIERFFADQARSFGLGLEQPFRINLAPPFPESLPPLPLRPSLLSAMLWSLKMRWLVMRLKWSNDRPTPDIILFAVYHGGASTVLERSGGLRKGLIAVANVFADRRMEGANHVVIAHELLHTLGATDKYHPDSNLPRYPEGFADSAQQPLYPQTMAELMAGRIAVAPNSAEMPDHLGRVLIGSLTAAEIGWTD